MPVMYYTCMNISMSSQHGVFSTFSVVGWIVSRGSDETKNLCLWLAVALEPLIVE